MDEEITELDDPILSQKNYQNEMGLFTCCFIHNVCVIDTVLQKCSPRQKLEYLYFKSTEGESIITFYTMGRIQQMPRFVRKQLSLLLKKWIKLKKKMRK